MIDVTRILITGGAGNVGSALALRLSDNPDNQITIVDNLLTGNLDKVPKRDNVKFIKADVNDYKSLSQIFIKGNFNYVFHFAAVVGVQRTLENPLMVLEDIKGFENILSLSAMFKVIRVYFSSSSEVYGEPFEIPQNENTTPLNSRLPYAIVKNVGESYFKTYKKIYNLDYCVFRFFNTYGPHQSDDFVIPKFIRLALANEPITIYGDGLQTRTFCYVDDNIDTIVKIHNEGLINDDVINIGNDEEYTIKELAQLVIELTRSKSQIVHLPALEEGDMRRRCPDISKMKTILGYKPRNAREGITKYIEILKNENRA